MSGVDDRIVSMKFDNQSFEQKLASTIGSLDKLRVSLDMANQTKGLQAVNTAAQNMNLGHIAGSVDAIKDRFNALTVVAVAALTKITQQAVASGERIIKAFVFEPVMDGFREFETNMNSIQTILANTKDAGSNLNDVNAALDQLNQYSDQTIYNFSQMARNIGTFTAAGVGLDQSVNAIKGIANLAAISGSSSDQASTAMYQLSQALAAGKVSLMDWNSVVNAGMGGEVFKKALFETGKAMKTITDVPVGASFDEWEKKGGTFREQMQKGWITADVLSTTLESFSGNLDVAGLKAIGFSDAAAQKMVELGKLGIAAATEVKTFTQLVGTVKEAVGSGWSATFRTVIGDFEESKALFTSINNSIGAFIAKSSQARNDMLKGWKDFGGRTALIEAFKNVISAVGSVLRSVSQAFREFFPKTTSADLLVWTAAFKEFTEKLKMGGETLIKIREVFRGVFSTLQVGWEIVKGVIGVVVDLVSEFTGVGRGLLDFTSKAGGALGDFNKALLYSQKIPEFFDKISAKIHEAIEWIKNFKDNIVGFFDGFSGSDAVEEATGRVSSRLEHLTGVADRVAAAWQSMSDRLNGVKHVLAGVWDYISNWFKELGSKLAAVMVPGDFDAAVDIVNVGLLGGIAVLLKKFLNGGLKIDFGQGLVQKISKSFDTLTGTLKAMQADLKAKALLKIAGAVGILTISMVALSMIDSAALTKALIAIGVGFGQLVTVMALMDKVGGSAVKTNGLAASLILMATAVGILSLAVKNMAGLSWDELARGLVGTAGALTIMVTAMKFMSTDAAGLIAGGIAMSAMAVGIRILAEAVGAFADMEWESMAQGLVGVGAGLAIITTAMNFMPVASTLAAGAALIPMAIGLRILSEAVSSFADMSWSEMGKGLLGIGGGLAVIAATMSFMPVTLPITAAGVLILSGALLVMAEAVQKMGSIDFGEMAKGIGGLAAMLLILVVAMNAMNGSIVGAASLVIVAGALVILTEVLKELSKLSWQELAMALGALAISLTVLGLAAFALQATGALTAMIGLGAAMLLIGGGVAAVGIGIMFIAKAFEVLAKTGTEGVKVLAGALPTLIGAFAQGALDAANELLAAVPLLVKTLRVILGHLLDTVIELVPKIAEALSSFIGHALTLIREKFPEIVTTGYELVITLLTAIRDNIGQIIDLGTEIIINFAAGLVSNMPKLVEAAISIVSSFLTEMGNNVGRFVTAGTDLLVNLLLGISQNISQIVTAAGTIITSFINEIVNSLYRIVETGLQILEAFLSGIANNLLKVASTVTDIITKFISAYGDNAMKIIDAGFQLLKDLLKGIADNIIEVVNTVGDIAAKFVTAMGDNATKFLDAGADALTDFLDGIEDNIEDVTDKAVDVALKFIEEVGSSAIDFTSGAADLLINFLNDLTTMIDTKAPEIRTAALKLLGAIFNAMLLGLPEKIKGLLSEITRLIGGVVSKALGPIGGIIDGVGGAVGSVVDGVGGLFKSASVGAKGAGRAVDKVAADSMDLSDRILIALERVIMKLEELISALGDELSNMQPVITPVVDTSEVETAADRIKQLLADAVRIRDEGQPPLGSSSSASSPAGQNLTAAQNDILQASLARLRAWAGSSIARSHAIATTNDTANPGFVRGVDNTPREFSFTQNIYSPTALSVADIYRNTKSQIALAKDELEIA